MPGRVLLYAWGSRGDVQPMVALGRRLRARGHDVAVATAVDFASFVTDHGLRHEPIDIKLGSLSRTDVGRSWLGGEARHQREELRLMGGLLAQAAPALAAMMVRTAPHYDHIVTIPVLLESALTLAEGAPVSCALLQPSLATADGRSSISAVRPGRSPLNLIAGSWAGIRVRPVISSIAKATCVAAGKQRLSWREYFRGALGAHYLLASSPLVTPPVADWPADVRVTGYWQLPHTGQFVPDDGLAAFLADGDPPVYLGFGSMTAQDASATSRLVGEALRLAGVRAIVRPGLAGLAVVDERIHCVGDLPFSWLFPRLSVCIHHGGAGTTATALTAGVGQVIVPHMGDQPFWARRMHELGVAAAPLPRRRLTAESLANAIRAAQDPSLRERTRRLGGQVAAEDGVGHAVTALEAMWTA